MPAASLRRLVTTLLAALIGLAAATGHAQQAASTTVDTEHGQIRAETIASGLGQLSALRFLPDGTLLIAQRSVGRLRLLDPGSGSLTEVTGVPDHLTLDECNSADGSCGIQDVALHPDFADNQALYVSYSEGPVHYCTLAVDRFVLDGAQLTQRKRIFTAEAYAEDDYHFGGHMALRDGYLFVTVGDRHHRDRAQQTDNHAGTIVRLHDDGRVPEDNPLVTTADALPEIWSFGHRNAYGLMFHPETGELWSHDHGPAHGDELNRIVAGGNYGWPTVSFGWEYGGGPIGQGIRGQQGLQPPVKVWVRGIAPSGLAYYDGDLFPAWRGSFLIGSLARVHLNRLRIDDGQPVLEERVMQGAAGRVRSVAVDDRGAVWFGADTGMLLRLTPEGDWASR